MPRIYVPLRQEAVPRLLALAELERRSPQDQAAYILECALGMRNGGDPARPESADQRVQSHAVS